MRIGAGTIWVAATLAIMAVLAFRIAAGGSDLPQPSPAGPILSLETEASLLLGKLARDPVLVARGGNSEFANDVVLIEIKTSEGFEDLGQAAAIVLLSAIAIASGLVGAVWLKGRLSY